MIPSLKSGYVKGYIEPQEVFARCQKLAEEHPDLVDLVVSPLKTHGYDGKDKSLQGPAPLYYLRLGPKTADRDHKVGVLQFASPHAREWVQPMIMTELAEELVENYDPTSTDPQVKANTALMQGLDIYICPMTNPDGTNYSFHDQKMWRKNRDPQGQGEVGVDVNRNYPYKFTTGEDPSSSTFAGPAPLSEPETKHVAGIVEDHPNIDYACDWHSYASEIRQPYGVSPQDAPMYDKLHQRMQKAIEGVNGNHYDTTVSKVICGASDDYFYNDKHLYATIVEDGQSFQPKPAEAQRVMNECVAGARELLQVALENGPGKAHPPAVPPPLPPDAES